MKLATLVIAAFASAPAAALTAPPTDCPLRNAPFSVDSPLLDILLSAKATAAANVATSGAVSKLSPFFTSTEPPTFATIITLRQAIAPGGSDQKLLVDLDSKLRALPVTAADRLARCARYDNERPHFALRTGRPHLLLFEKITGFKDSASVDAAHAMFLAMAKRKGWDVAVTDAAGVFTPASLARFDAVIWNNVSGDVLTLSQRRAFRTYVEKGGGFVGVHGSGGDPVYFWDWYTDRLLGARFEGHPMRPQFQNARIVVDDKRNPAAANLPTEWRMKDEWYSFKSNPRSNRAQVIATIDESSYDPASEGLAMGDHPIAWTNRIGRGKMFYSAIGHRPETYSDPHYVAMIEDALSWIVERKKSVRAVPKH